jgi:hypothetical protein
MLYIVDNRSYRDEDLQVVDNFQVLDMESRRGSDEPQGEPPLIYSCRMDVVICALFVILFLSLLGLIDRQPSPTSVGESIGDRPGLTLGSPVKLFPFEMSPETSTAIVLSIVASALAVAVVRLTADWSRDNAEAAGFRLVIDPVKKVASVATLPLTYFLYTGVTGFLLFRLFPSEDSCTTAYTGYEMIVFFFANLKHGYLLLLVFGAQIMLLGMVGYLYQRPLIPKTVKTPAQLDRYIVRIWKFTQLGLSSGVAVAVGVSLPILIGKTGLTLMNTMFASGFLLAGALALLAVPALKIHSAGKLHREMIEHPADSLGETE